MQYNIEIFLSIIPLLAWLYLLFFYANRKLQFNGLFWKSNIIIENQKIHQPALKQNFSLCFIIPARNEEKYIGHSIQSCIDYLQNPEIIIINDSRYL